MKYISPILAAMFHVAGSLLVVFNSFRLVRQGEELEPHTPVPAAPAKDGALISQPAHQMTCA